MLKDLRIGKKYSTKDMGKMLNISKTYYWQLENRRRNLSYSMAVKIAAIFDLKPDKIFYDDYKNNK